jgi:hypothetical protein
MTHAEGTWDLDSLQAITLRHQPASGNRTLKIQKKKKKTRGSLPKFH